MCIRSNTAHEICKLDGEVPETIISGETSDISKFSKLAWYEWVKYHDKTVVYPDENYALDKL